MSHTSSSEVKPVLNTLPLPPTPCAHTHTHAHFLISTFSAQVCAEAHLHWANSEWFGWFYLHLLRSPGPPHIQKKNKKNQLPPNHFNTQSGVYLLENSVCSTLSERFQVDYVGKLYTGGVNTHRRLLYVLFLLFLMSYFRRFVLFLPLAITLMCFCICLPVSNFSCLLDCVFVARALSDLNAFVDRFPVAAPACLHMQLSSVSDLSCSVAYCCIWIFFKCF